MGKERFVATNGWLYRWRKRANLEYRKPHREAGEANHSGAHQWSLEEWPKLVAECFPPSDIYNADETGLYYRALPEHTFVFKNDNAREAKACKERITLLGCGGMAGENVSC